jgi:hypothetical protein
MVRFSARCQRLRFFLRFHLIRYDLTCAFLSGACMDCWMKYLNCLKKVEGDLDHFDTRSDVHDNKNVNVSFINNTLILTNMIVLKDKEVDTDTDNTENRIEIAAQTEITSDIPIVSVPIKRCTKSHK